MGWLFAIVVVLCGTAIVMTALITGSTTAQPKAYPELSDGYEPPSLSLFPPPVDFTKDSN